MKKQIEELIELLKNKIHIEYDKGYRHFQKDDIEESRRCRGKMEAYNDCIHELKNLLTSRLT